MSRTPNKHGGGAMTNANGLYFEQTTSLDEALNKKDILLKVQAKCIVIVRLLVTVNLNIIFESS